MSEEKCQAPNRNVPELPCGYPLPCPFHGSPEKEPKKPAKRKKAPAKKKAGR